MAAVALNLAGAQGDLALDAGDFLLRHAQRTHLGFGDEQGLQPFVAVGQQGLERFLADLFAGDHVPGVDPAVAVVIDAPLHAAVVDPAVLIWSFVPLGIDLAVDLDAVLEILPDVDFAGPGGVEEAAQRLTVVVDDLPAHFLALGADDGFHLARGLILRRGRGVIDAVHFRTIGQHLHAGGPLSPSRGRDSPHQQEDHAEPQTRGFGCHPLTPFMKCMSHQQDHTPVCRPPANLDPGYGADFSRRWRRLWGSL